MVNTINMKDIRHLNLFGKITKINTRFYFNYNNALVFCVPRVLVSKAVGEKGKNVIELNRILKKKIKIIAMPNGIENARSFVSSIVSPVEFRELEVDENDIVISANRQSKAALIGRDKRRLIELQKIMNDFFGKGVRIV